jgi:DNA sulfur modification protein DndD
MRLKQLTITNFGIYKDENTFNFPYSEDKKVSMIIGKNGSGKTTFLNAMKVCLFGSMILKNRTITKNYEEFIINLLNKNAMKEALSRFSIKATFISQVHNFDGEFTIERVWDIRSSFKEEVYMMRNGKQLSPDDQESFFNALYHAFPLDLFDLFYLDGEKIDQLSVLNTNLIELLESSINIDLFKKLNSDLINYAVKRINNKHINQITLDKKVKEEELDLYKEELSETQINIEKLNSAINIKSDELDNFKKSLNINTIAMDQVEYNLLLDEIRDLKKDVEHDLINLLPFTLVKDQLLTLLKTIEHESLVVENQTINKAITSLELKDHLLRSNFPKKDTLKLISAISDFYSYDKSEMIHHLNNDDYYSLRTKITKLTEYNKDTLHDKIKKLNVLESRQKKLSKEAEEFAAAKKAGQLDTLLNLQKDLDKLHTSLTEKENVVTNIYSNISTLEEEIKILNNEIWSEMKKNNINNILDQIHTVLDQYIEQVKLNKINEIEFHTKSMFDRLIRKEGFIKDFKLQDEEIYLLDEHGNQLNHSNLSAGEKQLFILSLIYAILQSSERTVPLMFDTLLGRLDEEHRENVFKEFISNCPDQVIILATDSELANIDRKYLENLVNTEYTIDFSKKNDRLIEMRG